MIHTNTPAFGTAEFPVVVSGLAARRYPLAEAQLEVWLSSQQSTAANCAYNEIATLTLRGPLNRHALESAIQSVYQRHGCLRATFDRHGREVTEHPFSKLEIEFLDWLGLDSQSLQEARRQLIAQLGSTPFDLQRGPLFRVVLQKAAETNHFLTIMAHHLVLDGWSLGLIVKDLGSLYDHYQSGLDEPTPACLPSYADYTKAMQQHADSQAGRADLTYWVDQFADEVPTLNLPLSGHRGPVRTYQASRVDQILPADLVKSLRKLGAKNGCSLYNAVLAAFQAFAARLGQTDDLVLAIPTAGQSVLDFPELVGHCVNTLPLRIQVDVHRSFTAHLKRSREVLLESMEHQRFSFGTLLKHLKGARDPSRPPLCAVSFNLDPVVDLEHVGFKDLAVGLQVEPRTCENFEWFVNGIVHTDQSIELQVQFNLDLFQAEAIAFYLEGFQAFLEYLVANPQATLAEIPMMSLRQRQAMMVEWNDTHADYPRESNLPAEFARQAQATPDRVAVRATEGQLTYRQLEEQSSQFARFLALRGVKTGDLVGICAQRTPRLLVMVLGILKAGAGYVPLDPQYPAERLRHMCDDSGLTVLVSEDDLTETVAALSKPLVMFQDFLHASDKGDENSIHPVVSTHRSTCINAANICYVIYTSGSTGTPKGVMVPHGSVVNFLYSMKRQPGYDPQENVLAITTLSFDIAVLELYLPLVFGGTVFIADAATSADGKKLSETVEREDIRLMQATPATWRMMLSSGWKGKQNLKILCGGEPMPAELVEPLLQRGKELWNLYGPTETTVWSTASRIISADAPTTIGRPIANTQIYLLDAHGQEVPVGVEGEIMIGGAGVTLGYWNRPELTRERFINNPYFNPFADYVNHQLYRTGDIACYRLDGTIEYRRRNDKQVKLRGFRIELGEIEAAIRTFPGVAQTVVIVRNEPSEDARLVAYLTVHDTFERTTTNTDNKQGSKDGGHTISGARPSLSTNELREHLRGLLPRYMIPQHFVLLEAMPLTANGKVNVNGLPTADASKARSAATTCQSPSEKYLQKIWQETLQLESVSREDNFFDIGGHSLLVMQVINEVETATKIRLSPQEFLLGTLEQLATQLDDCPEFARREPLPPEKTNAEPPSPSRSPFDCLKRFWR